jgi:type IV fimbrial biogenesis protein FimT
MQARRPTGFTLIELLIVLAILGVLFGVALPSYTAFMEAGRAGAAKSALLSSVTQSISRAAITGQHVVLCPSNEGETCTGTPHWSEGWIAFVDRNNNRSREPDEPLVLRETALGGKVRLNSTVGRTRLVFQPNGGNAGSNVTFTLCDGRGPARAQTIVLSNTGRLRYGTPSEAAVAATCPG